MNWDEILNKEFSKPYYKDLEIFLQNEYITKKIYPEKKDIYRAFALTKFEDLKVVILGQDPYHKVNQAQGLAFSTPKDIKNPPSMQNILKEINSDLGRASNCLDGDLTFWAEQGVFLLNTVLSVEEAKPQSHSKKGWENFTDEVIKAISKNKNGVVFLLWGNPAIKKSSLIDEKKHYILKASHPSPLGAYKSFLGSRHFSKTNEILKSLNKEPIIW